MKIYFHNKGIEQLHLPSILRDKRLKQNIPEYFNDKEAPQICYKYTKPIAQSIFNYNKAVSDFDKESFDAMSCECEGSEFVDEHHGHIITGDLTIVEDQGLQSLLLKGPKFREENQICWNYNKHIIFTALECYKKAWAKREGVETSALDDYFEAAKTLVKNKVSYLKRNNHKDQPDKLLSQEATKSALEDLHSKFVLVPADKASNNIIVICKRLYYSIIVKELGLEGDGDTTNPTYSPVRLNMTQIIKKHKLYLGKFEKIVPSDKQENLPKIYWTPKLHKNPIKSRFIAGSRTCTTKKLSGVLTKCLKAVKNQRQAYCKAIFKNAGVNCFWVLKNSKDLVEHMEQVSTKPVKSITTWDFSTLYTTIPHAQLKMALKEIIVQVMSRNDHSKINCNASRAFFSEEVHSKYLSLDATQLCTLIDYLIDNIYIVFGSNVFRQTIGIPMGTDCAPLLADLFLHFYEYKFMTELMKTNIRLAQRFNSTFRYIDDLQSQNNPRFGDFVSEIYPPELVLKETTNDLNRYQTEHVQRPVSYLDMFFYFDQEDLLCYKLYDKRDDFSFTIVNFPYLCSNIPSSPAYGIYISQLVRYCRVCMFYSDFLERHLYLVNRLIAQGYTVSRLRRTFCKFFDCYSEGFKRYRKSRDDMIFDVRLFEVGSELGRFMYELLDGRRAT